MEINIIPKFIDNALAPIAKEIGEAFADLVHIARTPVLRNRQKRDIETKLLMESFYEGMKGIPEEFLEPPKTSVVGPMLEDFYKYYYEEEHIRDYYAKILVASVDARQKDNVHPLLPNMINSMSKPDVKVFENLREQYYIDTKEMKILSADDKFLSGKVIGLHVNEKLSDHTGFLIIDYPLLYTRRFSLYAESIPDDIFVSEWKEMLARMFGENSNVIGSPISNLYQKSNQIENTITDLIHIGLVDKQDYEILPIKIKEIGSHFAKDYSKRFGLEAEDLDTVISSCTVYRLSYHGKLLSKILTAKESKETN